MTETYQVCASSGYKRDRSERLKANLPEAQRLSAAYEVAAATGRLQHLPLTPVLREGVLPSDFRWLYEESFVKLKDGRRYYIRLRDGNDRRCALCNMQVATTLDHHVPQEACPVLAVTPTNLLPACKDCNTEKLDNKTPILNTYFDNLGGGRWLRAEVIPASTFLLEYRIEPQPSWTVGLAARAQSHFSTLKLGRLYTASAIRQFSGIGPRLDDLRKTERGAIAVSEHLQKESDNYWRAEPNGYETAAYAAAAESKWFCDLGYKTLLRPRLS